MRPNPLLVVLSACLMLAGCAGAPQRPQADDTVDLSQAAGQNASLPPSYCLDAKTPFWEQVVSRFAMKPLPAKTVERELALYLKERVYTQRMLLRSEKYLFYIFAETQRRGMPSEIALLPFVESAFKPEAVSRSKAVGLWQFIASTGDVFSLSRSHWADERRDVIASTRAALDYLEKLHRLFGDWHLALAAYNSGEGNVSRAIARNRARGLPADFPHLNLRSETRRYVPKLLAVRKLVENAAAYDFVLPEIAMRPYFVRVSKNRDMDLETAALLAETDVQTFRELNPGFNRPVALAAHERNLLVPEDKIEVFADNLLTWERSGRALSNWQTHVVLRGETVEGLAARYGMTPAELRRANAMTPKAGLKPGATVLVKGGSSDITMAQALTPSAVQEPDAGRFFTHVVRKGETLTSVAHRYGVSVRSLRAWNRLGTKARVRAGARVRIWLKDAPHPAHKRFTHRVRAGDTVFSIARKYGVSISSIKNANRMKSFDIRPGDRLVIVR